MLPVEPEGLTSAAERRGMQADKTRAKMRVAVARSTREFGRFIRKMSGAGPGPVFIVVHLLNIERGYQEKMWIP